MTDARLPIVVLCQVSYGLGHWVRTRALVQALMRRFDVTLVLGGLTDARMAIPAGVRLVQLPPKARGPDGIEVALEPGRGLGEVNRERRAILRRLAIELRPAAIVVEYFPFGRYELEFDVTTLVEYSRTPLVGAVRPPALVVCSLRDLNQTERAWGAQLDDTSLGLCHALFHAVLVHSDPTFASFGETFRLAASLRTPVWHTGFVVPERPATPEREPRDEVIVHVGGGKGGEDLLRAALDAWAISDLHRDLELRLVTGVFQDPAVDAEVRERAARLPRVRVDAWEPDLLGALRSARLSVSRCGYNTALDLVRARIPALVVPYEPPNEDEQRNRARRLSGLGIVRCLPSADVTPERLVDEIRATLRMSPAPVDLDLNGAETSAAWLVDQIASHRQGWRF